MSGVRKVLSLALLATVVLAGLATVAFRALGPSDRLMAGRGADLGALKLDADKDVHPVGGKGLVPGGAYTYTFNVTNTGSSTVRKAAVRSEKVIGGRAGSGLGAVKAQGASCTLGDRVDCVINELSPGETATVTIEARSTATRQAGDMLRIHTFLGRFVPDGQGGAGYKVIGDRVETCGCFVGPGAKTPAAVRLTA